jgi:histidinol dehydrogenase
MLIRKPSEKQLKLNSMLCRGKRWLQKPSKRASYYHKITREAMEFSNRYAPEHLIINTKDADELAEQVTNAGSVFIGPWTPESMGDYASGTNHTLPTYGYAECTAGYRSHSFQKFITMQKISESGLKKSRSHCGDSAQLEGLDAHKNAVSLRLKKLRSQKIRFQPKFTIK